MEQLHIGEHYRIQCYKHDGKIQRDWNEAVLLDIKKDVLIFGNNRTIVTETTGSSWKTKEPAILYFFKNEWFNIIAQLKKDGIYYYCNIATPYIIEEGTIKYIDYDLDLRVFPTGEYKILDRAEYNYHKKTMAYPQDLSEVVEFALKDLITKYKKGHFAFNDDLAYEYHKKYLSLH